MKNKTIGFFGDSYCAETANHHSLWFRYETYISRIKKENNLEIVNLGQGGSSVWDSYLMQLKPLIEKNQVPDICVFVWTSPARIFHRDVRRLNRADAESPPWHTFNPLSKNIWKAAKEYYKHLYDPEKDDLEYLCFLKYFDTEILPSLKTKAIHLWSTGSVSDWSPSGFRPSKISYVHRWRTGVEIRPSLLSLSLYGTTVDTLHGDNRTNHLEGNMKNQTVYKWITSALEEYRDGKLIDETTEIDKLFDRSRA